jgi:hypothetical protein
LTYKFGFFWGAVAGIGLTARYLGFLGPISVQDAMSIASMMKFLIYLSVVFGILEAATKYLVGQTTLKGLVNGASVGSSIVLFPIFGIQFP